MEKVFISTSSFGVFDSEPINMLKKQNLEVILNDTGRKLSEEESITCLKDVDYLIAGTEKLTKDVLSSARKLKVISRCGAGMDSVDLNAAKELGIKVVNTPDAPTLAVAELTIGLILDLLRKISFMDSQVRQGVWKKYVGNLLKDKKLGIIGLGRIGGKVAELLSAFDCHIAYFDPFIESVNINFKKMELKDLLAWADILTIHIPSSEEILGEEELNAMKKGAWLINTSRGGIINEAALYEALKTEDLSGAALDVFEKEPYEGKLKDLDNVLLTPHVGSYAKEARVNMEREAVENLLNYIN